VSAPAPDGDLRHLTAGRVVLVLGLMALATLVSLLLAPLVGAAPVDLRRAFDFSRPVTENPDAQVLFLFRLPRVVCAALAGAGLAAAGVAFQAVLRNPLATPYTLGVSSGGALGAVLAIRIGLDALLGPVALPGFAFAGALATVALVYSVARVGRNLPPATLLLAGVTMSFVCGACMMFVQYSADYAQSYRIVRWLMGGLDVGRPGLLWQIFPPLAVGLVLLQLRARDLNAMAAGAAAAASVGVEVERTVRLVYLGASLIVGAVVAVAGPIGFVGLVVPHALRHLLGPDHRILLPASALGGAVFLVWCDTIARTALAPAEIPVGVLTAMVGGPFFLWLLWRRKGRAGIWG
jgi:iron complex transport system permease protein